MKLRYTGTDAARDLALSGGFITFPRNKWVDVDKAAEAGGLRAEHAVIQARDVAQQDDWEADESKKSKTDPAQPAKEENSR